MPRIIALALLLAVSTSAFAAAYTWDGGSGSSANWTSRNNWVSNPNPLTLTNADITMAGTTRLTSLTDGNKSLNSLTFAANAGAFVIDGHEEWSWDSWSYVNVADTITLASAGITTNSAANITQTINNNIALAADQTWAGSGNLDVTGVVSGNNRSLTKNGTGTLTLAGENTYTGDTIIRQGTLRLGYQANYSSNIHDSSRIVMHGGNLDANDSFERVGTLSLQGNSSISMTGNNSVLLFADSHSEDWGTGVLPTLTVNNWNGSIYGGAEEGLYFGSSASALTATQMSQIRFFNPAGFAAGTYGASILGNGEVVPVPEPATMGLGALLLGLIGAKRRKAKLAIKA